ncbi:ureidoglycolate lyase [Alphaproteobacteria bacterium LSUCC0684]
MTQLLTPKPLVKESFAPYGDVLEIDGAEQFPINAGTTTRYHRLADVVTRPPDGSAILSIFRGTRRPSPVAITMMERHPLGSQAFYPLSPSDWLVVVADDIDGRPDPESLHCFQASGVQGVQYAPDIWHHPLLILDPVQDFFIVDRHGDGNNLEEYDFGEVVAEIRL